MTTPPQPQLSPAARLAAVLNILRYGIVDDPKEGPDEETEWMAYAPRFQGLTGPQVVRLVHQDEGYSLEIEPWSKSDLARVVAMLSPGQRERFDAWLRAAAEGEAEAGMPYAYAITAPASTWLDALCAATGVKDA